MSDRYYVRDELTPIPEKPITVLAPAKVNLALHVGRRRQDGYHRVCSLMEKISLHDTLRVRPLPAGSGFRLTGDVPDGEENTVAVAARALFAETGTGLAAEIELRKVIPAGAGLGGGSSDAAAALMALVRIFGLEVAPERLMEIAAGVGADVPFFLTSGPQLAEGAGEQLRPAGRLPGHALVLAVPEPELSTARVYGLFDQIPVKIATGFKERCRCLKEQVSEIGGERVDSGALSGLLHNDLEPAALALVPGIARIKEELSAAGARGCLMSGSGSAAFGLFDENEQAEAAAVRLRREDRRLWVVHPVEGPDWRPELPD